MTQEKFAESERRFQACLAFTLRYEGGRSNDPRDPGGRTMQGVTQATYDGFRAKRGLARKDVFTMPAAERDEIYRRGYWDKMNGDELRPGEDLCVFDFAVNSGPARALAVWKKCGGGGRRPAGEMIRDICARRLSFLRALRTWRYFGNGWGRRVAACEALATSMAYGKASPAVLSKKASEAKHQSAKASTQATVGGAVAGSAAIAHYLSTGQTVAALAVAVIGLLAIGIYTFRAWRQGQRADALADAASKLKERRPEATKSTSRPKARRAQLNQKTATIKKVQQTATAKAAIADLESKPRARVKAKKRSVK